MTDHAQQIPKPIYRLTYNGEAIKIATRASDALEWLKGRDPCFAIYAVVDEVVREVARGRG